MSMENVLDEVESLFQKISALPDNVRQIAINKIQARFATGGINLNENEQKVQPSCSSTSVVLSQEPQEPESENKVAEQDFLNPIPSIVPIDSLPFNDASEPIQNNSQDTSKVIQKKCKPRKISKCKKAAKTVANKRNTQKNSRKINSSKQVPPNEVHVDLHPVVVDHSAKSEQSCTSDQDEIKIEIYNQVPSTRIIKIDPVLKCDICDTCIKGRRNFKLHLKTHEPKKPYACPKCEKTFKQSSNLTVHLKRHNGQRDFPCNLCEYRSVTKLDLERHLCKHTQKRDLICEFCAKAFSVKRSLYLHIKNVHRKEDTEYYCAECTFVTHQKYNLKVHVRLRHLGDYYTHVCPVCGAKVKLKSAFLEHLRAHTGDKPFACDLCSAKFACVGRLNTHRRTIHAPRQFTCDICSKKFPTKYSLQRHETTHTNDKPHSCPFCNFACNMQGNLTKHVRHMHQQPDFSLKEYKKQQDTTVKRTKVKKKWTEKGQKEFDQYLNTLSEKLGRQVTVNELKAQEEDRRKQLIAAKEKAKIERINRITSKEHSYFLKPESPPPSSPDILPLPTNIYLEAIAAANLDFSTANLVESIPMPELTYPSPRPFYVQHGNRLVPPLSALEYSDFPSSSQAFVLPESNEDKLSMDPMLSTTYSEVLQVPPLGMDALNNSSLIDMPNVYVQLPNGDKVQWHLKDSQFIDSNVNDQSLQTPYNQASYTQVEGLREFLPSVMIVVGEPLYQDPEPPA